MSTYLSQQMQKNVAKLLICLSFVITAVIMLSIQKVNAATLVPGGSCSIDNAVASFNAGSDQAGCVAVAGGAAYGTTDTLDIPAGSFSYSNANTINVPLVIKGAGSGNTIVDLQNNNAGFIFENTSGTNKYITVEDLSLINGSSGPIIFSSGFSSTARRLTIYSTVAPSTPPQHAIQFVERGINGLSNIIEDNYIYDLHLETVINISSSEGAEMSSNVIRRNTFKSINITNSSGGAVISIASTDLGGSVAADVYNNTISNISFVGVGALVSVYSSSTTTANNSALMRITNNTLGVISGAGSDPASIATASLALSGLTAEASAIVKNNIILSSEQGGNVFGACGSGAFGGGGTESNNIISEGGNVIDSNHCSAYFIHTTDHNSAANLASLLGPMQAHGGLTPTMALLPGSPAIDKGITVTGLATDQRGVNRPQGLSFDAGAYEYEPATVPDPAPGNSGGSNSSGNQPGNYTSGSGEDSKSTGNGKLANTGTGAKMLFITVTGCLVALAALLLFHFTKKQPVSIFSLNKE